MSTETCLLEVNMPLTVYLTDNKTDNEIYSPPNTPIIVVPHFSLAST